MENLESVEWIKVDIKKLHKMWSGIKGLYRIDRDLKTIYIGEGECIKNRLFTHLNYAVFWDVFKGVDVYIYPYDGDVMSRRVLEDKLIKKNNPIKNGNKSNLFSEFYKDKKESHLKLGNRELEILKIIKAINGDEKKFTRKDVMSFGKLSLSKVQRGCSKLLEMGVIEKVRGESVGFDLYILKLTQEDIDCGVKI